MNKNTLIANGVYDAFLKERTMLFTNGCDPNDKNNYNKDIFDSESLTLCFRMFEANRKRKRYGLEELIKWCFAIDKGLKYQDYKIVFGTLTFNDTTLARTSKQTRRKYVSRFLSEHTDCYIANIDFGEENEREHYHFVALCEVEIKKNSWRYGFDSYREVAKTKDGIQKAKAYLLKLNNHSYKSSTRNERVIMNKSKNGRDKIDYLVWCHPREFKRYKLDFLEKM